MFILMIIGLIIWLLFIFHYLYVLSIPYFTRENLTKSSVSQGSGYPTLSIVVPARNEEEEIEECVEALAALNYPKDKCRIIVVNDNSTDRTGEIVEGLIKKHPNLSLVNCPDLPVDWTGKNFACMTGASQSTDDWICFIDADTRVKPDLLEVAIAFAKEKGLDLVSVIPSMEMHSFSERLLLPPVFLSVAATVNFKNVNDPTHKDAIASGQFMLFKNAAYKEVGGHRAVKSVIMEDIEFAKLMKQKGYRIYCVFAEELIQIRMYKDFSSIWQGFSKNMADIMRRAGFLNTLLVTIKSFLLGWGPILIPIFVFMALSSFSPPIPAERYYWTATLALLPTVLMFSFSIMIAKEFKIPLAYGPFFTFGYTLHGFLNFTSYLKAKKGNRVWKDRVYPAP